MDKIVIILLFDALIFKLIEVFLLMIYLVRSVLNYTHALID